MKQQHYQRDEVPLAHHRLSLMSSLAATSDRYAGKMRTSQSQQMSFNTAPSAASATNTDGYTSAQQRQLANSQFFAESHKTPASAIKQFIQLPEPETQKAPAVSARKSSSSLAFNKLGDLSARTLLSGAKTKPEPASSTARIPASASFTTCNYLIKYPSKQDSVGSALLLPPPPQIQPPSVRASHQPPPASSGENFYDEIDIYENDVFNSRQQHLRALYNDNYNNSTQARHSNEPARRSNEMTTSVTSGSSGSLLLENRSRNSNGSSNNLFQQFSSKINCFRNSQRGKALAETPEKAVPAGADVDDDDNSGGYRMKTSMSSSRIIYKSPPPSLASASSSTRGAAARSRASSPSPSKTATVKTIHLYNPCEGGSPSSSSSGLSTSSSFSRSSMASSSMKSSKSLKLRIKSPFKFHSSKQQQQQPPSSSKQTAESSGSKCQLSPASSGYNSSQDQSDSASGKQSVILSYCSINDDADAKSKYIDLLIRKKQAQLGTTDESKPAAFTVRRAEESPRRQQPMRSSFSVSHELGHAFTPKPAGARSSYALDENDNMISPTSNNSISSSSSSYSAASTGSRRTKPATAVGPSDNYMYLSDADSCSLEPVGNYAYRSMELKTSPFPRVVQAGHAQIRPTQTAVSRLSQRQLRSSASSGKVVELKIDFDEPIYENLNSYKTKPTPMQRQQTPSARSSFGGVQPKQYSVSDVLHSLKNLELSPGEPQPIQPPPPPHLTTIPIVFMTSRDDDDDLDAEQPTRQSEEAPSMIVHHVKEAAMSPATSTSSFSLSDSSNNSSYHYHSPKPTTTTTSTAARLQQELDDELCDEEVEFYLTNRHSEPTETACHQFYHHQSYAKQPIALWEQLV